MIQSIKSWHSQIINLGLLIIVKENQLVVLSKAFAVDIIMLNDSIKERGKSNAIISQLLRSGTSIGANIHEGNYAQSRSDFIFKMQIAQKECYETGYWLEVFKDSGIITLDEYKALFEKCSKIRKLLTASIKTAKTNKDSQ